MRGGGAGRRMRGAAGALALAFVLSLALGAFAGGAGAATTECAWQRHVKRVVTHVKRHGVRRRVVRIRHYWTCNPVLAPELTIPPQLVPPAPPTAPPPPVTAPEPEANAVAVFADDRGGKKSYVLSSPTGRPGPITVQLDNRGEDPHNLNIQREEGGEAVGEPLQIPTTPRESQTTAAFDLAPGTYHFYCSLFKHELEGMQATFVVE